MYLYYTFSFYRRERISDGENAKKLCKELSHYQHFSFICLLLSVKFAFRMLLSSVLL